MRYGFTTQALIARTMATAPAIVTTQSIATRHPCGRFGKRRSTGLCPFFCGGLRRAESVPLGVVPRALVGIAQNVVRVPQLTPGAVPIAELERTATVGGLDLLGDASGRTPSNA